MQKSVDEILGRKKSVEWPVKVIRRSGPFGLLGREEWEVEVDDTQRILMDLLPMDRTTGDSPRRKAWRVSSPEGWEMEGEIGAFGDLILLPLVQVRLPSGRTEDFRYGERNLDQMAWTMKLDQRKAVVAPNGRAIVEFRTAWRDSEEETFGFIIPLEGTLEDQIIGTMFLLTLLVEEHTHHSLYVYCPPQTLFLPWM